MKLLQTVEVEAEAFTIPHPILGDLKVRQALAYCTNKLDLIKSVYPLVDEAAQQKLVMNTFIPSYQWAYAGDENITIYPFDPEKGKALLDEAGWAMNEDTGFRNNAAGDELSPEIHHHHRCLPPDLGGRVREADGRLRYPHPALPCPRFLVVR